MQAAIQTRSPPLRSAIARAGRAAAGRVLLRPFDRAFDRLLAADTSGKVSPAELAVSAPNGRYGVEYAPTAGRLFQAMMTNLPADLSDYSFVDYGSGKGRVLCLAALNPFRQVVGVEFSEVLHRQALDNIAAFDASGRRRCGSITAVAEDAARWEIPETPCVFYLYNPFHAPVVAAVLERIRASWRRAPRKMHLLYYNPVHREIIDEAGFLRPRQPTLACRAALALSPHGLALYESPDVAEAEAID